MASKMSGTGGSSIRPSEPPAMEGQAVNKPSGSNSSRVSGGSSPRAASGGKPQSRS